jgi:hypothetical protein
MRSLEAFRQMLGSRRAGRAGTLRARRRRRGGGIQLCVLNQALVFTDKFRMCNAATEYVLHVMSFWAKTRFSNGGISARDARVAVDVVYHHNFLVFGQRSVHDQREFFVRGEESRTS